MPLNPAHWSFKCVRDLVWPQVVLQSWEEGQGSRERNYICSRLRCVSFESVSVEGAAQTHIAAVNQRHVIAISKTLRCFLGFCRYCARFRQGSPHPSGPLHDVAFRAAQSKVLFCSMWTSECREPFDQLKEKVLRHWTILIHLSLYCRDTWQQLRFKCCSPPAVRGEAGNTAHSMPVDWEVQRRMKILAAWNWNSLFSSGVP